MIRGLVETKTDKTNGQELYNVTTDFLQYLGINSVQDLPDYMRLHQIESLEEFLKKREENE